jgi:hypothetical protein
MFLDLLDVQSPIRAGYEPVMRSVGERGGEGGAGERFLELGGFGRDRERSGGGSPANHIFGFATQVDIVRNHEMVLPVDDFLVGFVGRL